MMIYVSEGCYLVDADFFDDGVPDNWNGRKEAGAVFALAIAVAVIGDLFASIALPIIAYFMFIQNASNVFIGISQSLPMFITSLLVWLLNICLIAQLVFKKNLFGRLSIGLSTINRFIRIMLIVTLMIALICNLVPTAPHIESEAYFGAIFAYNFLIAILETAMLIKAGSIGKKALFSLLIAFVLGGILGAISIEFEAIKSVAFEITLLTMLIALEISLIVFKKLS